MGISSVQAERRRSVESNTQGSGANRLVFQHDGNLVLDTPSNKPVWWTTTYGLGLTRGVLRLFWGTNMGRCLRSEPGALELSGVLAGGDSSYVWTSRDLTQMLPNSASSARTWFGSTATGGAGMLSPNDSYACSVPERRRYLAPPLQQRRRRPTGIGALGVAHERSRACCSGSIEQGTDRPSTTARSTNRCGARAASRSRASLPVVCDAGRRELRALRVCQPGPHAELRARWSTGTNVR